jgi:hypothetical protein
MGADGGNKHMFAIMQNLPKLVWVMKDQIQSSGYYSSSWPMANTLATLYKLATTI